MRYTTNIQRLLSAVTYFLSQARWWVLKNNEQRKTSDIRMCEKTSRHDKILPIFLEILKITRWRDIFQWPIRNIRGYGWKFLAWESRYKIFVCEFRRNADLEFCGFTDWGMFILMRWEKSTFVTTSDSISIVLEYIAQKSKLVLVFKFSTEYVVFHYSMWLQYLCKQ